MAAEQLHLLLYQLPIVGISDSLGRCSAQATSDKLEEGNYTMPLVLTGLLAGTAIYRIRTLINSMDLRDLDAKQKSSVIAAHFGISPEKFDAMPDAERKKLEEKATRDWLMLAGGAALMPVGAFSMCLIGKLSAATALSNPLFMAIATNMVKEVVRGSIYGGLRETAQEILTGPKAGDATLTHSESWGSAVKYGVISGAVNLGQNAAQQAILNGSSLTRENTWGQKISVLTAFAFINAIGESLNWTDLGSDRTRKCAELAKEKLTEYHQGHGMPEPTPAQLDEVAKQAEFAFELGVKDQSYAEALRNIYRRYVGSMLAREGVYACSNAISNTMSSLLKLMEGASGGKGSFNILNNILIGFGTTFTYAKFAACAQSLGVRRGIRAESGGKIASASESSSASSINWSFLNSIKEEGSHSGAIQRSVSVYSEERTGIDYEALREATVKAHSIADINIERGAPKGLRHRHMSDIN
ncbi:MAG TPA: hypothetical protein VGU61_13810 [Noviherbaspirillum sp.]|jgi:hypothetical protein|uniref:hypothetical protein n=1 Tax=Noviherbaspirillum sp. TaxID=1926288 RepID=UPI002DDCB8B4|nr:hypothetical protein [Noviherbaspirillum sp.]HEV2611339.1 hypothetical protein [Noviherbaspirillum sp.]